MTKITIPKTRDEILIYVAMLLVVESVYGGALVASPELRSPARLIPFTSLMAIHAGLHLIVPRLSPRQLWLPLYFVVQGVLAFWLVTMAGAATVTISLYLYLALAAQAIGLLSNRPRLAAVVVIGYLGVAALTYALLAGWASFPSFLVLAGPQTLFILAFAALFFRQAAERRRAQVLLRELEVAHAQLAEYANRVEHLTLASERQRLARELHDTLAQGLAGLILQLEAIDKQLAQGRSERAQAIAAQSMSQARATLAEARRAIDDLRASNRRFGDLHTALRAEVDRFQTATAIACQFTANGPTDQQLPQGLYEDVKRIVTEGLSNVAHHAGATQVWVEVSLSDSAITVSVRDNGQGFESADTESKSGHYGLIGMHERARLAGGSVRVLSLPTEGTTLLLSLPVPKVREDKVYA